MKTPPPIRVVVADDHSVVCEGLAAIINREPDMQVVAQARNWLEAIELVLENRPAVTVLDLHMRGMDPAVGVAVLREKIPAAQIIIFSAFGTNEEVFQVMRAGARGYVLKGESGREDLVECIRAVSRAEIWIHPVAAARLAERMTEPNLTTREIEVLRLMVVGKTNKEIGCVLDVTQGTVKVHVHHILAKLGVTGRVEAVMAAAQRGLVPVFEALQDPTGGITGKEGRPYERHFFGQNTSKVIGAANSTSQLQPKK